MAQESPRAAHRLPPSTLAAARQHVLALSARDREALLRALLEQYEQPQAPPQEHARDDHANARRERSLDKLTAPPLAPRTLQHPRSASAPSMSALAAAQFECSPLPEDANEDTAAVGDVDLAVSSRTSHRPGLRPAPLPAPPGTARASHLRSQSTPLARPLRSSFSTSRRADRTPAAEHGISRSLSASAAQTLRGGPNVATTFAVRASASTITVTAPPSACFYWCTSCGERYACRTAWARHDVTCRGAERRLASSSVSAAAGDAPHEPQPPEQRAWGCGFCAAFLGSLARYHDHVAAHFARGGKTLASWHHANVIYGLLHQPGVHAAWKQLWAERAAALPPYLRPKATWSPGSMLLARRPAVAVDTAGHADSASDSDSSIVECMSLQAALECFDLAHDSAPGLALQADSLAIFISVPVDDGVRLPVPTAGVPLAATARTTKNDPLPSLPPPDAPPPPAVPAAASAAADADAKKRSSKRSSAKPPPRRPLFHFRTKSLPSGATAAAAGDDAAGAGDQRRMTKPPSPIAKLVSRARPRASVATPARSGTVREPLLDLAKPAEKPAPSQSSPPSASSFASSSPSSSSSASSLPAPLSPLSPPSRNGPAGRRQKLNGDWGSITTTIVDDSMMPLDAARAAVAR